MPKVRLYFDVRKDLADNFKEIFELARENDKTITRSDMFELILYNWLIMIEKTSKLVQEKLKEEKKNER